MARSPNTTTESPQERTAKRIAYILLGIYGAALLIIGIIAAIKPATENQTWVELFKSGFLILGGGLTTIIGYYFGSRGVQEAQTSADEARRQRDEAKRERQELATTMTPTYDESSLIIPDDMPDSE